MRIRIPFVAAFLLFGCAFAAEPSFRAPSPVDVSCPYGHKAVRRVPVLNGLIAIDAALQKKTERFEIVLGGCTGSDTEAILCGRCGFRYYSEGKKWERTSTDRRSFNPPISAALRRFEDLCPPRVFEYVQEIGLDGSMAERSVLFSDEEDVEKVRSLLVARMKEYGTKELVPGGLWLSDEWTVVFSNGGNGTPFMTMVMITHQLKKADQAPAPIPAALISPAPPEPRQP
jgi:hypothetical protein